MKILITGGTSATALKILKAFSAYEVILGAYGEVPSFSSTAYTLISLGDRNDDTIAHSLLNNCLDLAVEFILPLSGFEVEAVAKSAVLFKEFNIEILLPSRENLNQYFNAEKNNKSADWIVFVDGEVIFATVKNNVLIALGRKEKLGGAYYFNGVDLSLITI